MRKAINTILKHYEMFGLDGVSFLFRKKFRKTQLISLKIKGYKNKLFLRNGTTDVSMFYYLFEAQEYNFDFDFEPQVIIDCGAHIGLGAVFFAHKYPNAMIYSVEPEKSNFEMLLKNTAAYPNIKCLNYGVWNKSADLKIVDTGIGNWGFMTEEISAGENLSTPAISIPEIMERFDLDRIDICKINIEGAEKELFEYNYKGWLSKTRGIIIELHDKMRTGCSKSFFGALADYNFEIYPNGSYLICLFK